MCTVSYVVTESGYILTSNRDEDPLRGAFPPEEWHQDGLSSFKAPRDAVSGGTWFAVDDRGRSACVLNGAFEKQSWQPPYPVSRGLLIPTAFRAPGFSEFFHQQDFSGMAPFTLILIDECLQVVRWDGHRRTLQFLSRNRAHLWSSSTLYSREEHEKKLDTFSRFLEEGRGHLAHRILELHGVFAPNNFIIDRPGVKTVSVTQVVVGHQAPAMHYVELHPIHN